MSHSILSDPEGWDICIFWLQGPKWWSRSKRTHSHQRKDHFWFRDIDQ